VSHETALLARGLIAWYKVPEPLEPEAEPKEDLVTVTDSETAESSRVDSESQTEAEERPHEPDTGLVDQAEDAHEIAAVSEDPTPSSGK